ncbi:MAG TPA: CbiQ family ECF transporter T component [Candidatus Limnocylindria bacterium]|nr:CbiQ family ECF transporter T component [Candidatus Limnocylindria bacterium]
MIQLAGIDYHAASGSTAWHRASALTKLLLAAAVLAVAVFARSITLLLAVHGLAWLLVLTSRMPRRLVIAAAGYPIVFSVLFVIGRWDGSWETPLRLLARPLTASLTAVWLVGTTPYPDLFAPISRVLPRSLGDGLFLTYRALFALLSRIERLWHALVLRGGNAGPPRRRLALAGEALATLIVHGFERSQRLYETMLLRGHSGRICGCRHYADVTRADGWVAACGAGLAVMVTWLWNAR